jgi:hypothetical protein
MTPYIMPLFMMHIWMKPMQLNFNAYFWRSTEQFKSLSFMEIVPNFSLKYNFWH